MRLKIKARMFFLLLFGNIIAHAQTERQYYFSNSTVNPSGKAIQVSHPLFLDITLSPGDKKIVFINFVSGFEQLFMSNSNFSGAKQLTFDSVNHEDPAWSPDGKWIAFVKSGDESEIIFLMDTSGKIHRQISPDGMKTIHPSWSPDSQTILFCSDDDLAPPKKNESVIYSRNIITNELKTIITGGTNTFPVMSPDGKKIAFRRMIGEKNSEIFIANSDGSTQHNITNHPAFDGWPCWSPDGKWIAFASNRNSNYQETPRNTYQIFVMDSTGNHISLIANTSGRATSPKWSADGKYIYMTNCTKVDAGFDCNIYSIDVSSKMPDK